MISAVLDCGPHIVIGNVELREQGAVRDVVEALGIDTLACVLDKELHHLHAVHLVAVMHRVHVVLPGFGKVLLCHFPDGVSPVDYIILAALVIHSIDREIGPHHHAPDKSLFLVLHGVHLYLLEGLPAGENRRGIHKGNPNHPALLVGEQGFVYGDSVNSRGLCHQFTFREIDKDPFLLKHPVFAV